MQPIQFEGHLAVFRPGSYYRRHLDQFRGVELSTLTAMLCLNGDWTTEAGGALCIYTDPADAAHPFPPAAGVASARNPEPKGAPGPALTVPPVKRTQHDK